MFLNKNYCIIRNFYISFVFYKTKYICELAYRFTGFDNFQLIY